jgi:hypothetical protein
MKNKDKTLNQKTPKVDPHRADHLIWRLDDVEILLVAGITSDQSAPAAIKNKSKRKSSHTSPKVSSSKP